MLGRKRVPAAPTPVVTLLAGVAARLAATGEVTPAAARYLARRTSYSIDKARAVLGYEPAVDLDEGMRRAERWLRSEGLIPARR